MIGLFDSGFGGLTVLKQLNKDLPEYDYVYLGDNARAPYGSKSYNVIFDFTKTGVEFLFKQGCNLVIIACNTASARALRRIQQEWLPKNYPDKKVLGVLIPVVEAVIEDILKSKKKNSKIGIIGTKATINSRSYEKEIEKRLKRQKIVSKATPLLVPLVEEGWLHKKETKMILRFYLRFFKQEKISHLILGCTHYPFLKKMIKEIMYKDTKIVSTPKAVAEKLKMYIKNHPEIELSKNSIRKYYTTNQKEEFKNFYFKAFRRSVEKVKSVVL